MAGVGVGVVSIGIVVPSVGVGAVVVVPGAGIVVLGAGIGIGVIVPGAGIILVVVLSILAVTGRRLLDLDSVVVALGRKGGQHTCSCQTSMSVEGNQYPTGLECQFGSKIIKSVCRKRKENIKIF